MITTLNCVDHSALKAIDKEEFESISRTTRSQVSSSSSMDVFGIDPQRDLIRSVAGKPLDNGFADYVAGADSLVITTKVSIAQLADKAKEMLSFFNSDGYKTVYPWIDNFLRIKDKGRIAALDGLLLLQIESEDLGNTFLSSPRLIDAADPVAYRYPGERMTDDAHDDLRLSEMLQQIDETIDIAWLKRRKIREFNLASDKQTGAYAVYDALIFEAEIHGRLCILSRGEWFEVALDYVQRIEQELANLDAHPTLILPEAEYQEGEGSYNERVAQASNGSLFLLDTKTVNFGGGRSRIEICDLFGLDGTLIHVKAKTKSSTLSHLFVQGVVSAQLLRDASFRTLAATKCDATHGFIFSTIPFAPSTFRVTFAIISSTDQTISQALPFLSKQSLANAARELKLMGYPVSLNKIPVGAAPVNSE